MADKKLAKTEIDGQLSTLNKGGDGGWSIEREKLHKEFVFRNFVEAFPLVACRSTAGGIVRPSCLALFRLMISSNFVGCSTGRSPGFAPLRILST